MHPPWPEHLVRAQAEWTGASCTRQEFIEPVGRHMQLFGSMLLVMLPLVRTMVGTDLGAVLLSIG